VLCLVCLMGLCWCEGMVVADKGKREVEGVSRGTSSKYISRFLPINTLGILPCHVIS